MTITYIDRDGKENRVTGREGDNVLYLAHRHEIDLEGLFLFFVFFPSPPFFFICI